MGENQAILYRINMRRPEYSHKKWQSQWEENQKFMDNISHYPQEWWMQEPQRTLHRSLTPPRTRRRRRGERRLRLQRRSNRKMMRRGKRKRKRREKRKKRKKHRNLPRR